MAIVSKNPSVSPPREVWGNGPKQEQRGGSVVPSQTRDSYSAQVEKTPPMVPPALGAGAAISRDGGQPQTSKMLINLGFAKPGASRDELTKALLELQDRFGLVSSKGRGFDPATREGVKEYVRQLKGKLQRLKFFEGNPDGKYDPTLRQAVKEFQTKENLEATGHVDFKTYRKIDDRFQERQ